MTMVTKWALLSVFGTWAAYLLYRTPFDTSLFEDVGATGAAIAHTFRPRDRARPHR